MAPVCNRILLVYLLYSGVGTAETNRRIKVHYSFSSLLSLAFGFVTRMQSCCARSTSVFLFLADTPCAISAQNFLFCIMSTSSSLTLWMRTFLKPVGSMCLVFLLDP